MGLKYKFVATLSAVVAAINAQRSVGLRLLDHEGWQPVGSVTIPANHPVPQVGTVVGHSYDAKKVRNSSTKSTVVMHSTDFGKTWKGPAVLDKVLGAYPSFVELPDGRILVAYYTEGKGSDIRCLWLKADAGGVSVLPR